MTKIAVYRFNGWTISNRGREFWANKAGFFTGYHECETPGQFLDYLTRIDGDAK